VDGRSQYPNRFSLGALDDAEARERSAKKLVALLPDLILTQNTPPTASMLQQTRARGVGVGLCAIGVPPATPPVRARQSGGRPVARGVGEVLVHPLLDERGSFIDPRSFDPATARFPMAGAGGRCEAGAMR